MCVPFLPQIRPYWMILFHDWSAIPSLVISLVECLAPFSFPLTKEEVSIHFSIWRTIERERENMSSLVRQPPAEFLIP